MKYNYALLFQSSVLYHHLMSKRKRQGGRRAKKSTVRELTFDSDDDDSSALVETQSFTFLGSGSGRKARTTHVHGRHGLPDSDAPGSSCDAPATNSSPVPSADLAYMTYDDNGNDEDAHSNYADSDFFGAFDATEMHFDDDDERGDHEGGEGEEAKERTKEILAGVSHFLIVVLSGSGSHVATVVL
jgi:hypothetical protein